MNTMTKRITYTALMAALVFLSTFGIKIPLSFNGGYIHAGDGFVLLCGIVLGPLGALAAGIGSAMADILGGYANWALPTFIIKALMALIVGLMAKYSTNKKMALIFGIAFTGTWIGFVLPMKQLLKDTIRTKATILLADLDSTSITSVQKLEQVGQISDVILLLSAFLIPVILIGLFAILYRKNKINFRPVEGISFVVSGTLMIILYYIATYIMYGNAITPILDIPPSLIQFTIGIIIANLLYPIAKKMKGRTSINNP